MWYLITLLMLLISNLGYTQIIRNTKETVIKSGNIELKLNSKSETKIELTRAYRPINSKYYDSERLISMMGTISNFDVQETLEFVENNTLKYIIRSKNSDGIEKTVQYVVNDLIPSLIIVEVQYVNHGNKIFDIKGWANHAYSLESKGDHPSFYAFIGSSSSAREDWVQPIDSFYWKKNFMGMNNSDYGGGTPILDVWRKDVGISIGHLASTPKQISFPIMKSRYSPQVEIMAYFEYPEVLRFKPNDTINTLKTFIYAHSGDYFSALRLYSSLMQSDGYHLPKSPENAYYPQWCAWGYERTFTIDEILQTLPKVKELGFKWVTIDDGYQITEGDWTVNHQKFPGGLAQMKALVDTIHSYGLLAQLWWAPLSISPDSKLIRDHPNYILRNSEWAPQYITWWDAYYMAPTDTGVIQHTTDVLKMFIHDWGFDGLKLDGQHMNAVPPDFGNHGLDYPEQACEKLPKFFDEIYTVSNQLKKDVLIQHCPCGTCMSFFNLSGTNQTVSSDPLSSKQIRQKGKYYKAVSPQIAYFGDHVELSDYGNDFASTIGIGGVPGSKFTWPKPNPNVTAPGYLLTPDKENIWKKWIDIYEQKKLSKGEYLGELYDIGYDKPEAHVIQQNEMLYFAFYSETWDGTVVFKGLDPLKKYKVYDYVNNKNLGMIQGNNPNMNLKFNSYLLVHLSEIK